jgi:hypothetical protein
MSSETIDTIVTVVLSAGLVLAGVGALAALPWRRGEVDAAHRAWVTVGHAVLAAVFGTHPAPAVAAESRPLVVARAH